MSDAAPVHDEEALRARFRELRQTGSSRLRDDIIVEHAWIARTVARRFDQRGEAYDDLVQVASVGLVKAVDRFDPEMGTNFVSFAMPTVVGEVRRYFRDHTWSLRVPRSAKDLKPLITKAIEHLQHETGRSPSVTEIAAHLQMEPDAVLEAMEASAAYRTSSLDAPMRDSDGGESQRWLGQEDRELGRMVDATAIRQLLETLPGRSRMILYLRFFEHMSQAEIAEHVGTSQVHVGRLLKAGLEQLRGQISAEDLSEVV
ncbi:MAG TPA: SigB/SigF/SigG family RNA polymerase sigma factor [Ilumatobacteraceae bacterium]|jgi:RNA polymerase sigma-B factor